MSQAVGRHAIVIRDRVDGQGGAIQVITAREHLLARETGPTRDAMDQRVETEEYIVVMTSLRALAEVASRPFRSAADVKVELSR